MDAFVITGGSALTGEMRIGGAKNVALKALIASLLTDESLTFTNVPLLKDVRGLLEVLKNLGARVTKRGHTVTIRSNALTAHTVSLEDAAKARTSSMVIGPLLARYGEARIANPGGCRIGARPIDRHIEGLKKMGATIRYSSDDGFFYAKAKRLVGTTYTFDKNTHTGTETLILAAVLADGETVLKNAAAEVEIDDLIDLLNSMGARIKRTKPREIVIHGVSSLHGADFRIPPDRNEEITFAIAAAITHGTLTVTDSQRERIQTFLDAFEQTGGNVERIDDHTTVYSGPKIPKPVDIVTGVHPGFMTDWQAPWAVYMTQAKGESTIHETIYERRFSYVPELRKMGARIEFYDPTVDDPTSFYNFNWADRPEGYHQGIRISGPQKLHNAVLSINDLRAGATLVLAALTAEGESYIHGVEQIDRGYQQLETRLRDVGAHITRVKGAQV